ncbi:hypothetical protein K2173_017331 [Erythroxylum novogranatense]|uniref:Pectinesterase n=1 Tax=Erythroxylum novogranatense TaxID=1862640 RepID=A0AAV8TK21_9ROSI|nr:hypothetical protein K2173_017331 [Erythroxylum novogranatense]
MGMLYGLVFWLLLGCAFGPTSMLLADQNFQNQCKFTRYPALCLRTFVESKAHPEDIMSALVNKTISETKLPSSYFTILDAQLDIQQTQHALSITDYCKELMNMSLDRLHRSVSAIQTSPTKNKNDIQTWLSASLTFQETCRDSADSLALSGNLAVHISRKMDYLSKLTSNSLALVNRITSSSKDNNLIKDSKKTRQLQGTQYFPSWVSPKDRKLLQSTTIRANAVVAKDGTGNYRTISEAISAASGNRFEKIRTYKDGITLIGDGKYSTIVVGDDSVAGGSSMPDSATFTITGDGFIARDIGFQNTAGPGGEQALALYVASDHSVLYRCSILGYQDTLFALALRQFYRECDIYGTIDFIFGNAAAVFQNCNLVFRRPASGRYNVMLANGRTDPGQNTGFSVQNCRVMAGSDFAPVKHSFNSYLGRPWKQYSRSVVMQSNIDEALTPRGWIEWPGQGSYMKTLYFAEFSNAGAGGTVSGRVKWPGFHVIGATEASKFTVANLILGDSWLPSTGVIFNSGLH